MEKKIQRFFAKYQIPEQNIEYIIREDGKTRICLSDGRVVETYIPLKSILTELPPNHFVNINKGIALAVKKIAAIRDDIYIMDDGREFKGRARMPHLYKYEQERRFNTPVDRVDVDEDSLISAFSVLDNMPIPFCVAELVFDQNGNSIDFRFCYVNDALADMEALSKAQLLSQSFYSIFKHADRKWLVACADIALNGKSRVFQDYTSELNKMLTIYCFQPAEGFCACAFMELPAEEK